MSDARLDVVMKQTGVTLPVATDLLRDSNWNVEKAISAYWLRNTKPSTQIASQSVNEAIIGVSSLLTALPNTTQQSMGSTRHAIGSSNSHQGPCHTQQIGDVKTNVHKITQGRLKRGLSKATPNVQLVTIARDIVTKDMATDRDSNEPICFVESPVYTFLLPNLNKYAEDFKAFLHKDLIETCTLVTLEQSGHLNWWSDLEIGQRLYPLVTSGDGNCLLHAASLAMWGFHDRELILRRLLGNSMTSGKHAASFYRRWRWHQNIVNKQYELILSEAEWQSEWKCIVKLSSPEPRKSPILTGARRCSSAGLSSDVAPVYESLEDIHVFVLSHVLRRPIFIIAQSILKDVDGAALAPIPFCGIYLPLECNPHDCHKSPLILAYDSGHFSALVWMDSEKLDNSQTTIPLIRPNFDLLPFHFVFDPGSEFSWQSSGHTSHEVTVDQIVELASKYLDIIQLPIGGSEMRLRTNSWGESHARHHQLTVDNENASKSSRIEKKSQGKSHSSFQDAMSKTFGSLGRSFSKKFKGKDAENGRVLTRKKSIGSSTQSTRTTNIIMEMLGDHSQILCANVTLKKTFFCDDFIQNYLDTAQQRFQEFSEQRGQQHSELRRLSAGKLTATLYANEETAL